MKIISSKTPLIAAFFLATVLVACQKDGPTRSPTDSSCNAATTLIATVQGTGPASNMVGQRVDIQGILTFNPTSEGFYIEEPVSDNDERSSNAIFLVGLTPGEGIVSGAKVQVRGTVAELEKGRNSLTSLTDVEVLQVCGGLHDIPLTLVELPMNGLDREAIEGMHVSLPDTLTITDNYNLSRGQIGVSATGLQYSATELMQPGTNAKAFALKNQANILPVQLLGMSDNANLYVPGSNFDGLAGVMAHDDRELRLTITTDVYPTSATGHSAASSIDVKDSAISRAVSMNLYNYFNGDGAGGGFPAARGAKTAESFQKQRHRIGAALHAMLPELVAVMELENDGFGPQSATADFIALLESEVGGSWATARPENDNTGSDAIKVAIFYRSDLWQPQGSARTISGPEFKKSRQPLAQAFSPVGEGESILLVVNHFKSKGSCPDAGPDTDQQDGQGCWSAMRTRSAELMTAWVKSLASASQTDNTLIMGDLNSYRREAPIDAVRAAGYEELLDSDESRPFSYMYYGRAGTLDYAFVSPALKPKVKDAFIWQVNSIMPNYIDLPQPWLRFSDHDPVVVDLSLRH